MADTILAFDSFEVDLRDREVRKAGVRVRLQEQPFQILAMMLERPGEIVTRDEIRDRLWADGTTVDFEHSVNAAVKRLRAALGDVAESPRYVETLHRRGYRFIAPIERPFGGRAGQAVSVPNRSGDRRPRLAISPFANLSGDPSQDYFSDGLTEEMIAQLGRRCATHVGVLARTSSMSLKGTSRTASEIGEWLHIDYLVEGSVRREKERVRITAQLIETRGETHLWAESYDRQLSDCLDVQTEVASHIAHALIAELVPERDAHGERARHPDAYQAYLKGRFHWNKAGDGALADALACYDEALRIDPTFSAAHSGRARVWVAMADYYKATPRAALSAARTAADQALALNRADPEAHVALAEVRRVLEWDFSGAESAYRSALAENPNHDASYRYYAVFLAGRGRAAEAAAAADRACDLDPLCLVVNTSAAAVRYFCGDFTEAVARCRHTLDMDQRFIVARRWLAASLVQLGRSDEAIRELEKLPAVRLDAVSLAWVGQAMAARGDRARARAMLARLRRASARRFVPAYHLALLHAALDDKDAAIESLSRACDERDPWLGTVGVEPRFRSLRTDPRFVTLLGRLGLA